ALGDPTLFEAIGVAQILSPGEIEIAETSLLSTDDLAALQAGGPPFDLADLSFTALGSGPVTFGLVSAVGVTGNVPEPASWSLLLIGLPLVAALRRRHPRAGAR
ncbi:MAG: PEP-CTERM sorting domain-containing protein, partial [Alphaproteobacteria bacterium]|nr:PEP-CTERM sorting domain-containing protein [Alphaproteobacteria bacterium]